MKTTTRTPPTLLARTAGALATAIAIALVGAPIAAQAQVTPAANAGAHRPSNDTAANGTPVVNIVAPSAGGVSHNQYDNYNVDQRGVILNNAATVSQTQQAGYIVGNPNLQPGQSAKVILNEVTSANPSLLQGYTEVAGNRAEVVIANPNGITCDGCGFINTSRATLTTGTPVFGGGGSLAAFRVTRGAINVAGNGLDSSNIDRLDLIARSVAANAKVWANQLNVVTGANQVGYSDLSTQAINGEGERPGVSIDVAALGGMYANHIRLLGTEAGVGVRVSGELAATAGDFELTSAGKLVLTGKATATGNLGANVTGLDNSGTLAANGALGIVARDGIANSGKLYAIQGALSVTAGAFANAAGGDIYAANSITLGTTSLDNAGSIEAGQSLVLNASGALTNSGKLFADAGTATLAAQSIGNAGTLSASGDVALTASGTLDSHGTVVTGNDLRLVGDVIALGGQLQAGRDATVQARTLDNDGVLYAKRDLALSGGDIANTAMGTLLADGNASLANTGALGNQGSIQAGGSLHAGSLTSLDNAGTLYAGSDLVLRTLGALANSNTLYAGGTLQLNAASLDNSGTLRSAGAQTVVTAANATNSGTAYAGGASSWQVGGQLISTGTLAAQGDLGIAAAGLAASGLLGAGVQGDGSLGSSGALTVATTGLLAATGQNLSAGQLLLTGEALDLHSATTRAGGDISLTANGGGINHATGDLATDGVLAIKATQAVDNSSGTLQAGQLALNAGALTNRAGSVLQTGSNASTLAVTGAIDNTGGRLASNTTDLTLRAGSLNNTDGTLAHAGNGTATVAIGGVFDNTRGSLASNGALTLTAGGALNNSGGSLSAARDVTLSAASMDNTGGALAGSSLDITVAGDVVNAGGAMQSGTALTLRANMLANGNGQIKGLGADPLSLVIAQSLSNAVNGFIGGNGTVQIDANGIVNAGQVYAGTDLGVTSHGGLDNRNGALQAMGSTTVSAAGALTNTGGRIEAGSGKADASLAVTAASLDNSSGRIANAATGNTTINVAGALTNTAGTLGGQGTVGVTAASIGNTGAATIVAGNDLNLATGSIDNSNGTLYAARNLAWSNSAAGLTNRQGHVGAGGNTTLVLNALDNTGGETAANGDVGLTLGSLAGSGRVVAGNDLALSLAGNYTNVAGNTLKANRNATLNIAGAFVNAGGATLESVNALTVNAGSIDNASGASINSGSTTLNANGDLTNEGRIEGDTLSLRARNLTNTGTLMGDTIIVHAANLTNGADLGTAIDNPVYQSALIAATQSIGLYVTGTLLNRDAQIFTLGDLTIAANEGFARSLAIINRSGDIEADGNINLAASQITNERRVFQTSTHVLSDAERAQNTQTEAPQVRYRYDDPDPLHHPPNVDPSQVISAQEIALADAYCQSRQADNLRCIGYPNGEGSANTFRQVVTDTVVSRTQLDATSAEGRIVAGQDITLSGSLLNDKSTLAAGRNLSVNGQGGSIAEGTGIVGGETISNIAWAPTAEIQRSTSTQVQFQYLKHDPRTWVDGDFEGYGSNESSTTLGLIGSLPSWITLAAGPVASARITAGETLTLVGAGISNTTVGSDGKPVNAAGTLGSNGGVQSVGGNGPGRVGSVTGGATSANAGQIGPQPGAQTVGSVDAPAGNITLPSGGLFTTHPGSGSGYLIETDPRFATQSGFLGSDYLMNRLNFNGEDTLKRLGDAFYETRLVLDQITSLTGRRYLDGNSDATAQYRELMDNGVAAAGKFNLAVGVALTPEQMASLTTDIVWLVSQEVNGEKVLVPVVYLSAATAKAETGGASLAGKNILLDTSGNLTNNGSIKASQDATLKAGTLLNTGNIAASGALSIAAAQDILNGGSIQGGNVALVAGRDVVSTADIGKVDLGGVNLGSTLVPLDAQRLGLTTGGSIAATGNLQVQAGRDLSLVQAPVSAGKDLSLNAGRDVTATDSTITAGGDASIVAGRDLSLNAISRTEATGGFSKGTETTTHTVTTVTAGGSAALAAGQDISGQGAVLKAGDTLAVSAGRDVNLAAVTDKVTQKNAGVEGHTVFSERTTDETLRGTSLDASNGIVVSAGRDITATAASANSDNGGIALVAGHDVTLNAGVETHTTELDTKTKKSGTLSSKTTKTHDATESNLAIGTVINGSSVAISAGHDLTAQGTQVTSSGAIALAAGNDINLTAAQDVYTEGHDKSVKTSGFQQGLVAGDYNWQSKKDNTTNSSEDRIAVGTVLSGDSVTVAAGHDLTAHGAQIAGTNDVVLAAGNNLTLTTAENTHTEAHDHTITIDGFQRNGLTAMVGESVDNKAAALSDISYTGSLVGSTNGSVTLSAGKDVHITGSDVISQTGTAIVGQNVTIDAAVGSTTAEQKSSYKSLGVTAGFGGALMEAAQSAYESGKRGSEVKDDRLKALYAAQAAYQAYDTVNLAEGAGSDLSKDGVDGGINLQLGIGASNSHSDTRTYDEQAYGSHIRSQGNVTIAATGGDLNIIGSEVDGKNVALAAAHDINLLSQAEQHTDKSDSKSSSGGIGVQVGTDGIGIYAQAAVGKSNAHGNGTTHAETIINASDALSLVSGNDTTIKGAQLKGESVLANIGGNLLVESEQDTDDYASKQQQASGKVVIGYSSGASGSYSQGKMDSHYTSVNEVSGISAGQGGYAIYVGGDTHLKGGVIASDADPSKNYLSTGTLSYEDIKNEANYSASSFGVSGGYGSSGGSFSGSGSIPQSESESSTTRSGLALGTIDVRSGPVDLSGLDRNPTLDNQALKGIFDQEKIQEQQELGQVASTVGFRAAGDLAGKMGWAEGSPQRAALHGLVGAAAAALGGGDVGGAIQGAVANQVVINVMEKYLVDQGYTKGTPEFDSLMQAGSLAVGAAAGGTAGGLTALKATQNNWLLHQEVDAADKARAACDGQGGDVQACKDNVTRAVAALDAQRNLELFGYANSVQNAAIQEGNWTQADYNAALGAYWSAQGIDRSQVVVSGYGPANEFGYQLREGLSGFANRAESAPGRALTTLKNVDGYLSSHNPYDVTVDAFNLVGNAASGLGNWLNSPVPAQALQSQIDAFANLPPSAVGGLTFDSVAGTATAYIGGKAVEWIGGKWVAKAAPVASEPNIGGLPDHLLPDNIQGDGTIGHPTKDLPVGQPDAGGPGAGLGGLKSGITADEIAKINSSFGGTVPLRDIDTIIANADNYDGFYNKAGSMIRDIAGGHMFDNGNKRTAVEVVESLIVRNGVDGPPKAVIWNVVDKVATGQLKDVSEIGKALKGG